MFNHVMVGTDDIQAAKRFYDAVLGALGYGEGVMPTESRCFWRSPNGAFGVTTPIDGKAATFANGGTIGFLATSQDEVDAWHAAGLANGGVACEDPPGVRANGMYLAYLRDPDGNKICAVKRAG
ncbi:VOC family protein [Albimonas sp. CAU 1670]|uniref:VOC family protein n=1 Tax=Albimonas sp. CAU 1670 TaxID=3032599 RepID=UPI0023DBC5DE|nr:VOC family protein [Albimonas sp. CAU 1670]MDF2233401.1 VOC family protein [Albimonas sp. CAU 1670]